MARARSASTLSRDDWAGRSSRGVLAGVPAGVVRRGAARCGEVRAGVARAGVVRAGAVRPGPPPCSAGGDRRPAPGVRRPAPGVPGFFDDDDNGSACPPHSPKGARHAYSTCVFAPMTLSLWGASFEDLIFRSVRRCRAESTRKNPHRTYQRNACVFESARCKLETNFEIGRQFR